MDKKKAIQHLYKQLLMVYGPQGWWPLLEVKGNNPTKTGAIKGYHPGDYSYPKTKAQQFEICVGAILTQNTSWLNVEKALQQLQQKNLLNPKALLNADDEAIKEAIRPAGYFNQKTKKLKVFAAFYLQLNNTPTREQLLQLWGIGKETADSMLLYAFHQPFFVVDAYTKRIFGRIGITPDDVDYDTLRVLVEQALASVEEYQEFHALLVEHAKRFCQKKPQCKHCVVTWCKRNGVH